MKYSDEVAEGRQIVEGLVTDEMRGRGQPIGALRWVAAEGIDDQHLLKWQVSGVDLSWRLREEHLADLANTPGLENALRGELREIIRRSC